MANVDYPYASQLRTELALRNRRYAKGRMHVESYGNPPVIVYAPEHPTDEDLSVGTPPERPTDEDLSVGTPRNPGKHGNFLDAAYAAIVAQPEWMRRFDKIHAQGARALPKADRKWRELDSSMSSDALLMNVFCTPGVLDSLGVRRLLGIDEKDAPVFGWKARVPLKNGRFDRTEVDMRLGELLVESKLTESDFQMCRATVVDGYRDFEDVFERDRLPRTVLPVGRRREAVEFPEDYSQEAEVLDEFCEKPLFAAGYPVHAPGLNYGMKPAPLLRANDLVTGEIGYTSYQLIRNVLAAYAQGCCFCVIHDERRPDLREAWFAVMAAVKRAEMRVRLKVLTWQELAAVLPKELQEFLDVKYGIVAPGRLASAVTVDLD